MIEFDLDDVITDCQEIVRLGILERTGYDITYDRQTYYVQIEGLTNKDIGNMVFEILLKDTKKMKAIPGAIESLEHIAKLIRRPIGIVTSRREKLREVTADWMAYNIKDRFKYHLVFTNGDSKTPHLAKDTRFFVDDNAENIKDLSKQLDNIFVINRGWNENMLLPKNAIRVNDLKPVARFISKMM
jgi:uncharacterized HAD superfamily protein